MSTKAGFVLPGRLWCTILLGQVSADEHSSGKFNLPKNDAELDIFQYEAHFYIKSLAFRYKTRPGKRGIAIGTFLQVAGVARENALTTGACEIMPSQQ